MSRVVLSATNTTLFRSISHAPRHCPSILPQSSLPVRLQRPSHGRAPIRYNSTAAAIAPVPEYENEGTDSNAQIREDASAEATLYRDDPSYRGTSDDVAQEKGHSEVSLESVLPPAVLSRIDARVAEWDQKQAERSQSKKERQQHKVVRTEKVRIVDKHKRQRKQIGDASGELEALQAENGARQISTAGQEIGTRAAPEDGTTGGKKRRWTVEQKTAARAMSPSKTAPQPAEGEKEIPDWRHLMSKKRLKEWVGQQQDQRAALITAGAPRIQYKAIDEAIKKAMTTGRIPKEILQSRAHKEVSTHSKNPSSESFSSPFFSKPTHSTQSSPADSPAPSAKPSTTSPRKALDPDTPTWKIQQNALSHKFGSEGWSPRRKLSPDAQRGIRDLHASNPELYSTPILAEQFKISPEAIRRILRSKWMDKLVDSDPPPGAIPMTSGMDQLEAAAGMPRRMRVSSGSEKMQELRERWAKRHDRIWDQKSELGLLPRRTRRRRVDSGERGRKRVEEGLWRDKVLEGARREEMGMA